MGRRAHGAPARTGPGGRPHAHERAEPPRGGGPAPRADPVPRRGRRGILREEGGEGRPRLPPPRPRPARRDRFTPRHQRPPPRHRREDRRGGRARGPRRGHVAVGRARAAHRRRDPARPRPRPASAVPGHDGDAAFGGAEARHEAAHRAHSRGDGLRGRPRPRGLPREPGAAREPRRADRRRRRVRRPRGGADARRVPRPRRARLRDRPPARGRAGAADDSPRREGPRVRERLPRWPRGGAPPRTRAASRARKGSRRSAVCATWA